MSIFTIIALAILFAGTLRAAWFWFIMWVVYIKRDDIKNASLSPMDWSTFSFIALYVASLLYLIF